QSPKPVLIEFFAARRLVTCAAAWTFMLHDRRLAISKRSGTQDNLPPQIAVPGHELLTCRRAGFITFAIPLNRPPPFRDRGCQMQLCLFYIQPPLHCHAAAEERHWHQHTG